MPREIEILNSFAELLDVFQIVTEIVQGDDYATINLIPLLYTEIEDRLNLIMLFNSNSNIKRATEVLFASLADRFKLTEEIIAAASVDPAIQHLEIIGRWLTKNGTSFHINAVKRNRSKFYNLNF